MYFKALFLSEHHVVFSVDSSICQHTNVQDQSPTGSAGPEEPRLLQIYEAAQKSLVHASLELLICKFPRNFDLPQYSTLLENHKECIVTIYGIKYLLTFKSWPHLN